MRFSKSPSQHALPQLNWNRSAAVLLVVMGVLLASCRSREQDVSADSRPQVLTTFTVLADLARNVAGDRLQVASIVKPGAEIHGYQPTPSDIERASKADLIVENGLGLELWAQRFTAAAGDVPTITLSEGMKPLLITEDAYSGKPNPHAWMSPQRTMGYVDHLERAFSQLDPAGAEDFAANASAYKAKLQALDQAASARIAPVELEPFGSSAAGCGGRDAGLLPQPKSGRQRGFTPPGAHHLHGFGRSGPQCGG